MTEKPIYTIAIVSLVSNVVLLYLLLVTGLYAGARREVVNCRSFPSKISAQSAFFYEPDKYGRLDKNNNGIACETYGY